jgi:hypothetical protein
LLANEKTILSDDERKNMAKRLLGAVRGRTKHQFRVGAHEFINWKENNNKLTTLQFNTFLEEVRKIEF